MKSKIVLTTTLAVCMFISFKSNAQHEKKGVKE